MWYIYFWGITDFLIVLTTVYVIFSFPNFVSISFISSISFPFSISKSFNNLEFLCSITSFFILQSLLFLFLFSLSHLSCFFYFSKFYFLLNIILSSPKSLFLFQILFFLSTLQIPLLFCF